MVKQAQLASSSIHQYLYKLKENRDSYELFGTDLSSTDDDIVYNATNDTPDNMDDNGKEAVEPEKEKPKQSKRKINTNVPVPVDIKKIKKEKTTTKHVHSKEKKKKKNKKSKKDRNENDLTVVNSGAENFSQSTSFIMSSLKN